jgi:hypothetical protein
VLVRFWLPIALSLLSSLCTTVGGWCGEAPAVSRSAETPKIPIAWFDEPEQHAPHWHVRFGDPFLIYSQRLVVGADAVFPAHQKDHQPDWHIVLRVADGAGKWFDHTDYTHVDPNHFPPKADRIIWNADLFVQPGTYRLVLLAYDATTEKHFVWRKTIQVERPSVLPNLDRDMPVVDFIDPGHVPPPIPEFLPIQNEKPTRIDVVFNLTGDMQMGLHSDYISRIRQRFVEGTLHGAAGVFSQLKPANGCVRMSGVDILHLDVALDRVKAEPEANLRVVHQTITNNRDTHTVNVHTLEGRTRAREFFRQFLDRVITDESGCGPDMLNVDRVVIVVSDSVVFPSGTANEVVSAPSNRKARFFHVCISSNQFATWDQVRRILDPLHPRRFEVAEPKDLRRAVAEIIKSIETNSHPMGD